MKSWILSIAGIIVFGVLVDVVLPKGNTSKYIKGIFAAVVVYVIISPLPKLLKGMDDVGDSFFDSLDFSVGGNVDMTIFDGYLQNISEKTEKMLAEHGYDGAKIIVRLTDDGKVDYINVNAAALSDENKTSARLDNLRDLVADYFNVDEKEVRIVGI